MKLFSCCILAAALAFGQGSSDVRLRAAIQKEEVEGDLKGAIEQYRKIAQGQDRAAAAKALVRMGQCYEKLGDAEARNAYERVMREFADQKEPAQAARARLATLTKSTAGASSNIRLVSEGGGGRAVSPDSRFLLQNDAQNELNLLELSTGQVRRIAAAPFFQPIFSPDCRQVAFMRRGGDTTELRTVNADGSGERLVWTSEKDWFAGIPQWFPDGKRILILQWDREGGRRLLSISVSSGNAERLWEGKKNYSTRLSPNGKFVTFIRRLRDEPVSDQIWLLSLEDKSETLLFDGQSYVNAPDWAPDGSGVVFLSDRRHPGAAVDLWYLRISDGKSAGSPILTKTGLGEMVKDSPSIWPAGPITRDGTYFFTKFSSSGLTLGNELRQVMRIDFDSGKGRTIGSASFVSPKGGEESRHASFSRDGKWLAYVKVSPANVPSIAIQSVESGEEKLIPMSPPPKFLDSALICPDGRSVLVGGTHPTDGNGIYRIDVQTGSWTPLKKPGEKEPAGWLGGISPDGRILYFNRFPAPGVSTLTARDLESGAEREIRTGPNAGFALSPDGKLLASLHPDGKDLVIVLFPTAGGASREIHRIRGEQFGQITWSADGQFILFGTLPSTFGVKSLFRIPAEGGEPQPTGLTVLPEDQSVFPHGFRQIKMRPDGRQLVYTAFGEERQPSSDFALSNFLPSFKPSR